MNRTTLIECHEHRTDQRGDPEVRPDRQSEVYRWIDEEATYDILFELEKTGTHIRGRREMSFTKLLDKEGEGATKLTLDRRRRFHAQALLDGRNWSERFAES